jgi:hypothetical protein
MCNAVMPPREEDIAEVLLQGFSRIDSNQFKEAEILFRKVCEMIEEQDSADGQVRPKGGVLVGLGLSLAL